MKATVEIEVTEKSVWLDGSPGLENHLLHYSPDPEGTLQELIWRTIGNKEPYIYVGKVSFEK